MIEYVFTLGGRNISLRSILQNYLAQLRTEVEYVTIAITENETIWLDSLIMTMGLTQDVINLYCEI